MKSVPYGILIIQLIQSEISLHQKNQRKEITKKTKIR